MVQCTIHTGVTIFSLLGILMGVAALNQFEQKKECVKRSAQKFTNRHI